MKANGYKIIISCNDGIITDAEMIVNGVSVKKTKAKRNPNDKFDWEIAACTAFNRLFEKKKEKKIEHDGCFGCKYDDRSEEFCKYVLKCKGAYTDFDNMTDNHADKYEPDGKERI